jgi:hypothetical protein
MLEQNEQRFRDWMDAAKGVEARNLELFKAAIGWAAFSLKTALLVNGGGAVALLAFLNSTVSAGAAGKPYVEHISPALLWFCVGVGLATLSGGIAYLTDMMRYEAEPHPWHHFERAHDGTPVPENKALHRLADIGRWCAIIVWAGSLLVFMLGATTAYCGFQHAGQLPASGICTLI